jgi:hypothetical protein
MSAYESVEKDTVVYGLATWVRTHDAWVLREEHCMVLMLLTGHMVHICQYWTYERGQGGMFLAWGSKLNRIDRILIPPRYTFFFRSSPAKNSRVKRAWLEAILG